MEKKRRRTAAEWYEKKHNIKHSAADLLLVRLDEAADNGSVPRHGFVDLSTVMDRHVRITARQSVRTLWYRSERSQWYR